MGQRERLHWDTLDYNLPLPEGPLMPEAHWPALGFVALSGPVRGRLNHLATYFTCEMFIHFERSINRYLDWHRRSIREYVAEAQIDKFIKEEEDHIAAFARLALRIRPDLYRADRGRFLQATLLDDYILRHIPLGAFFLMASLFEEMTLFVYPVMEAHPGQGWQPVLDVMRLHALEELGHIGLDRHVVQKVAAGAWPARAWLDAALLLPLVIHSDRKLARAWKRAVRHFAEEEGLTGAEQRAISSRGLSLSDQLGMQSYVKKNQQSPLPGNGPLCFFLNRISR